MRKIEEAMVRAVRTRTSRKFGNTEVRCQAGRIVVLLHGNRIAECRDHQWYFCLAGWPTPTTRSRINALAQGLNLGVRVWQERHEQYICDHKGQGKCRIYPSEWF